MISHLILHQRCYSTKHALRDALMNASMDLGIFASYDMDAHVLE